MNWARHELNIWGPPSRLRVTLERFKPDGSGDGYRLYGEKFYGENPPKLATVTPTRREDWLELIQWAEGGLALFDANREAHAKALEATK